MSDICLIYSTFGSEHEALLVANALVEKRLVACANVLGGATSVYHWEGKVQSTSEAVLVAKTTTEKCKNAMDEVKRLHSYEVPCIIACPIEAGFPPFVQWIKDQVT